MKLFTRAERAFIDALYNLLQKEHINAVHVTDLLEQSGYTKGAFYGRFENKYDFAEKIILKARRIHLQFLDRCGYLMWEDKDVSHPESKKNTLDFLKFVYEYRKLYDMIIDRKLCPNSLELFLFGADSPYTNLTPRQLADEELVNDMVNIYFGYYNSIVYIMLWRSMGYDTVTPERMVKVIMPIQRSVHNHCLKNMIGAEIYRNKDVK